MKTRQNESGFGHAIVLLVIVMVGAVVVLAGTKVMAAKPLDNFQGHAPIHVKRFSASGPVGLDPATIKSIYKLSGSGSGTIAIVDAFDYPTALI